MKGGFILLFFTLLFSIGTVVADEGITFREINSTTLLQPEEIGEYYLLLENIGAKELQVQIQAEPYVGLPSNDFDYVFLDPTYIVLQGHETQEVHVTLKLKEDVVRQKRYKTYVTAQAINAEEISTQYDLQVFAMPPQDPIEVSVSTSSERVGPGGELAVGLHLVNKIDQDLNNVDVYISSDIFEDQQTIELFQDQEKDLEFVFTIPRTAAAQDYSFNVRLYYDDELQASETGSFTVDENLSTSEYTESLKGFLYEIRTITIANNGNSVISNFYEQNPELFESWFTSYSLEPSYDEQDVARWTFTLSPEEEFTLTTREDYRPLLIGGIVILLLALVAYYLFVKRVTIRKETFKLKYSTDGVSEFKVLLHLKNNTNKSIKDITVVDVLPKLIQPKTNFGTLHPSGIERGDKGIRIMWKIPELVSGEERIISYEVEAQFRVIGDISLPYATVKYKNKSNKVTHIRSNKGRVVSGIVEAPEEKTEKGQKYTKK